MRKLLIPAALMMMTLWGCKANQEAYHAAYESATARRDSMVRIEETIYGKYRDRGAMKPAAVVDGDTLWVSTQMVGFPEGCGCTRDSLQRFNVVVGSFKQIFNAREMRARLNREGYPGAFFLNTREPLYLVVAATESTAAGALEALRHVEADTTLRLRAPLPYVLEAAHLRR